MSLKHFIQTIGKNRGKNPTYDWYIALSCFAVLFVVSLIIHTIVFFAFALGEVSPASGEQQTTPSLNQKDITNALKDIRQKDASSKNIPQSIKSDPSL